MTFKVTVDSVRECLAEQGSRCPVVACGCTSVSVIAEPGTNESCSQEHFTCRECNTEWTAYLYAAQVTSVMVEGSRRVYGGADIRGEIDPNVFSQIALPTRPLASALKDFIRQLKMGSTQGKGEALAKLAQMARIDLSDLRPLETQSGSPPSKPQELLYEAE